MPNISFFLTTQQVRDAIKDVTRRERWDDLEPGDRLQPVVKGMGLKLGQKVERIPHVLEVVSKRSEPLSAINQEDVIREGFPAWTPAQFIDFYCKHNKARANHLVNRIEFKYLDLVQKCKHCGQNAPARAHWYRIILGFGICPQCFQVEVIRLGQTEATQRYGIPGIHHSVSDSNHSYHIST